MTKVLLKYLCTSLNCYFHIFLIKIFMILISLKKKNITRDDFDILTNRYKINYKGKESVLSNRIMKFEII